MAQFVTRDNSNNETFRFDQSINRLIGAITINSGNRTGGIDIPDSIQGTPFFFCQFAQTQEGQDTGRIVTLEGRALRWTNIYEGTVIRYGVF